MSVVGEIITNTKTNEEFTITRIDRTEYATYVYIQNNKTNEHKVYGKTALFIMFGVSV